MFDSTKMKFLISEIGKPLLASTLLSFSLILIIFILSSLVFLFILKFSSFKASKLIKKVNNIIINLRRLVSFFNIDLSFS